MIISFYFFILFINFHCFMLSFYYFYIFIKQIYQKQKFYMEKFILLFLNIGNMNHNNFISGKG